jgi:hypothetical protein
MPHHILHDICLKLHLSKTQTLTINLGNNRPNITPLVSQMCGAASNLNALSFVIDKANNSKPLLQTIIYFNTHNLAYKGQNHLCSLVPKEM